MYLKILFIIIGFILFLMLSFYKLYLCKKPRTEKVSVFVSGLGAIFLLYIVIAVLLAIFIPGIINKSVLLFFGISPFIIGKLATYEKEKIYSLIQILFVAVSVIYTFII